MIMGSEYVDQRILVCFITWVYLGATNQVDLELRKMPRVGQGNYFTH